MGSTQQDIRELVGEARAQGWRVDDRGNKILLYSPDRVTIVTLHKTPSAPNWKKRAERHLLRGGFIKRS